MKDLQGEIMEVIKYARAYAKLGWQVLPIYEPKDKDHCTCGSPLCVGSIGKHPRTIKGVKEATTDLETIDSWYRQWPNANVGIATGRESGLVVLDIDPAKNGEDSLSQLIEDHGNLPHTVEALTGSGGRHIYYKYPEGRKIGNRVNFLPGLDIRGDGGYVVAPPSIHRNGKRYEWEASSTPSEPLADLPAWLLDMIDPPKPKPEPLDPALLGSSRGERLMRGRGYLAAAGPAIEGDGGDAKTFKLAGHLFHGFGLSESEVYALMSEWNLTCVPQWTEDELLTKIDSAIHNGTPPAPKPNREPLKWDETETKPVAQTSGIVLKRISEYEEREIEWLWPNRIAVGKLNLLAGDPGLGKSFVTVDIAARVSTGCPFADDQLGDNANSYKAKQSPGDVIMMSAEDDPNDTLRPRLRAAGANLSRIKLLEAKLVEGRQKTITMADLPSIEEALRLTPEAKLLIIDPVGAYVGEKDANADAEVRGLLHPLKQLAERYRIAILLVAHLNKPNGRAATKAHYRVMGSQGWYGSVRTAHIIIIDPEDKEKRYFLAFKSNIGRLPFGLAYSIASDQKGTKVHWGDKAVLESADELLNKGNTERQPDRAMAIEFLTDFLKAGPQPYKEVVEAAKANLIAQRTLLRAADELEIVKEKGGYQGQWIWKLPGGGTLWA